MFVSVQDHNLALQKRISDAESDMSDTQAALASRCQELSNITADWTSKLNEVAARHNEELAAERQKSFEVTHPSLSMIDHKLLCRLRINE